MLSSYFPRGGVLDEDGTSDLRKTIGSPSHLRHAKSTPALSVLVAASHRNPTLSTACEVSRVALLSPVSPSPAVQTMSSPIESFASSLNASPAVVAPPQQSSSTLSPAPENDNSFAQKIRYRLSSVARKPVALPFLQISHPFRIDDAKRLDLDGKAHVTRRSRTMSTSTVADTFSARKFFATPELDQLPSLAELDIKPQKYPSGRTFFRDGLAKAHKRFFSRSKESEESQSDTSSDEDEEDVNLIYSTVMTPLEFPSADDEENGFTIISPAEEPRRNHSIESSTREKCPLPPIECSSDIPNLDVPLRSSPRSPCILRVI